MLGMLSMGGLAEEEPGGGDAVGLRRVDERGRVLAVEDRGDQQGRALALQDGIHVVDDDRVGDAVVEGVRRRDHDVEVRGRQGQRAAPRERVQEREGLALLVRGSVVVDGRLDALGEERRLGALRPGQLGLEERRPEARVAVVRVEARVEKLREPRDVEVVELGGLLKESCSREFSL